MINLLIVPVLALLVFSYHYERNGNPLHWGELFSRLFWAFSFSVGYLTFNYQNPNFYLAGLLFLLQFVAILIPHAFAQRMGKRTDSWTTLPTSKWWPAWWLYPCLGWMPPFMQDFLGMGSVGFLRGVVVFCPAMILGHYFPMYFGGIGFFGGAVAIAINTAWQPLAYVLGPFIPFTLWDNDANSVPWGEFLIAFGWTASLYASVVLTYLPEIFRKGIVPPPL